jgi:hypothetical protein
LLAVAGDVCSDKKIFKMLATLHDVLQGEYKSREQICLNSSNFTQSNALAVDEITVITLHTSAQLIFICGIDSAYYGHEDLAILYSLKGTTTGEYLFLTIQKHFFEIGLGRIGNHGK